MKLRNKEMDLDEFIDSLMKTEKPPKFPLSMYYSEGTKYLNLFQYEKALTFLNEAVANDPSHFKSLLKRSKCFICLQKYEEAIEDADKVLKHCPDNVHAIDLKGQAQYLMGDYEGGYLTYKRGKKMKPVRKELRLGKQLCEDALNNSLHPCLETKFKKADVVKIAEAKQDNKKFGDQLKYRRSARECFGVDAKLLEDLMRDKDMTSIHGFCKEAVDFIKHRERFWGMETPLHSRKKTQKVKAKEIKRTDEDEKNIRFCKAAKRRATHELSKGRINNCLSEVEKVLNVTERLSQQKEKEKMELKCDVFHQLALAYRKMGNSSLAFQYLLDELKIAYEFNLALPQARAYHRLGESYQLTGDIEKTLQCLHRVIIAIEPENVEDLITDGSSMEQENQLQEALDWANTVISSVRMSIQESVITPSVQMSIKHHELSQEDSVITEGKGDLSESKTVDLEDGKYSGRQESKTAPKTTEDEPKLRKDSKSINESERMDVTEDSDEPKPTAVEVTKLLSPSSSKDIDQLNKSKTVNRKESDESKSSMELRISEKDVDVTKKPDTSKLPSAMEDLDSMPRAEAVEKLDGLSEIIYESDESEIPEEIEDLKESEIKVIGELEKSDNIYMKDLNQTVRTKSSESRELKRETTKDTVKLKKDDIKGDLQDSDRSAGTEKLNKFSKERTEEPDESKLSKSTEILRKSKKDLKEESGESEMSQTMKDIRKQSEIVGEISDSEIPHDIEELKELKESAKELIDESSRIEIPESTESLKQLRKEIIRKSDNIETPEAMEDSSESREQFIRNSDVPQGSDDPYDSMEFIRIKDITELSKSKSETKQESGRKKDLDESSSAIDKVQLGNSKKQMVNESMGPGRIEDFSKSRTYTPEELHGSTKDEDADLSETQTQTTEAISDTSKAKSKEVLNQMTAEKDVDPALNGAEQIDEMNIPEERGLNVLEELNELSAPEEGEEFTTEYQDINYSEHTGGVSQHTNGSTEINISHESKKKISRR